ncbi:hypothetical protein [Teredinibacter sp. KSP-S5-2]|uniref:hypothetical protein n=1 Tax=Teredinibacter sp. KSP-S5-2 TaxID=3034506 RepID=UPI002934D58E|nr:hypothetical protein [Teredinibacter sp. KSP-S5-2]WNO08085.1 hypothetical protein P5V12_13970 [Teredinibacter sp. KSP-S5-2]
MPDYDLKGMKSHSMYRLDAYIGRMSTSMKWIDFKDESRKICDYFLTLSAANLLVDMKIDFYYHNLCRSAENWRRYLLTSRDHYKKQAPLTYISPLYAAVAAGEVSLVKGISDLIPDAHVEGEEYPDKFLIAKVLALVASNGVELTDQITSLLKQMEEVEDEPLSSNLFKALLGVDELKEEDFWDAFEAAHYAHDEMNEEKITNVTVKISEFIAHRFIWFEGIAWLKLAKMKGFTLPSNGFKYCPDEALGKMKKPYMGDWPLVPLPDGSF